MEQLHLSPIGKVDLSFAFETRLKQDVEEYVIT